MKEGNRIYVQQVNLTEKLEFEKYLWEKFKFQICYQSLSVIQFKKKMLMNFSILNQFLKVFQKPLS